MATVTRSNTTGVGYLEFVLDDANDETTRLHLSKGETVLIHVTGLTANSCTAQIKCYVGDNATGVVLKDAAGTSSFTADFAYGFTAPGKCSISVILTIDGGGAGAIATFTK